jgi:hypothetical protein
MGDAYTPGHPETLSEALERLNSALELLDAGGAPGHISAHVDLAIHELYNALAVLTAGVRLNQINRNADFQ